MRFLQKLIHFFSELTEGKKNLSKVFFCLILPNVILILIFGYFYVRGVNVIITNIVFFIFIFLLFSSFIALWKTKGHLIIKVILIFIDITTMMFCTGIAKNKEENDKKIQSYTDKSKKEVEIASKKNPSDSPETAMENLLIDKISKADSELKKLQFLSGAFFSFYLSNDIILTEYCGDLGVDVKNFSKIFRQNYKEQYSKASKYLPSDFHSNEVVRTQLKTQVRNNIDSIANNQNISSAEFCKSIVTNAEQVANKTLFSIVYPRLNNMLISSNINK